MATGARTITVIRTPRVDKLSPQSTSTPAEKTVTKVIILPRQSKETERGWVTIEGWEVWILPTSKVDGEPYADGDILPSDTVRVDGVIWSMDGPPAPFDKGTKRKGTRLQLKRVGS